MGWEAFSQYTWFEIGVGNRVKFWQDCWCGDQPSQLSFPVLYEIAINREASIEFFLARQGEGERQTWDVRFTWNLNDWELDLVVDLFHILESNTPSMDNEDRMKWKLKKNGDFDIRSLYYELRVPLSIVFPWKVIWKVKAPR